MPVDLRLCRNFALSLAISLSFCRAGYADEPSYEQAVARWPDMRRPITFLGCKNHPFEFAFMWNGNISATPGELLTEADRLLFSQTKEEASLISFAIGDKPLFDSRREDQSGERGLAEGDLPIAQVKLRSGDEVLSEEGFAVDAFGSPNAAAWNSPVFLRLRFRVLQPGSGPGPIRLWAQIAGNGIVYSMHARRNVRIPFVARKYKDELHGQNESNEQSSAVLDEAGRIVLAANRPLKFYSQLTDARTSVSLEETGMDANLSEFELPRSKGEVLELVLPFTPVRTEEMRSLRSITYDQSRTAVANFWKEGAETGHERRCPGNTPQPVMELLGAAKLYHR